MQTATGRLVVGRSVGRPACVPGTRTPGTHHAHGWWAGGLVGWWAGGLPAGGLRACRPASLPACRPACSFAQIEGGREGLGLDVSVTATFVNNLKNK